MIDPAATADIQTRILSGKAFEFSETRNGSRITIKGELAAKRKGSYHLLLTVVDWADAKTNGTEHYEVDLAPGAPERRAFVSSFVFQRIILLTRVSVGE